MIWLSRKLQSVQQIIFIFTQTHYRSSTSSKSTFHVKIANNPNVVLFVVLRTRWALSSWMSCGRTTNWLSLIAANEISLITRAGHSSCSGMMKMMMMMMMMMVGTALICCVKCHPAGVIKSFPRPETAAQELARLLKENSVRRFSAPLQEREKKKRHLDFIRFYFCPLEIKIISRYKEIIINVLRAVSHCHSFILNNSN